MFDLEDAVKVGAWVRVEVLARPSPGFERQMASSEQQESHQGRPCFESCADPIQWWASRRSCVLFRIKVKL